MLSQEQIAQQARESMMAELRTLAKRANQRMVRLERKEDASDKSVSYSNAQLFLSSQNKKNKRISSERFVESTSTMKKMTDSEIQAQLNRVKAFLKAESSTVSGTKKIEKNRTKGLAKTVQEKFNKEMTLKQAKSLGDLFGEMEKKGYYKKKGQSKLSSDEVIIAYYEMEEAEELELNPGEMIKNVKTYEEALKVNEIFKYNVFDLSQFDNEGDEEGYEEN